MKKAIMATVMAVVTAFVTAVGLCVRALTAPTAAWAATDTGMTVVLDAGHGGVDGGVTGVTTGVKESDINLAITRKLAAELEDMGFIVVMTRKTEAGLYGAATKGFKKRDMQKRKEIIADADPSLVVSIHQNLYPTRSPRGGQVFYKKEDEEGKRLATEIQTRLNGLYEEDGAKERTVQTGEYFMLECAPCPSVIVECGFLSNVADEALLTSEVWQKRLAEQIAAGIVEYLSM